MKSDAPNPDDVQISLSLAEALVLFEFLSRFTQENCLEIRDQAEQRVLWNIQGDLEHDLAEPLSQDYKQHLQRARDQVRDPS